MTTRFSNQPRREEERFHSDRCRWPKWNRGSYCMLNQMRRTTQGISYLLVTPKVDLLFCESHLLMLGKLWLIVVAKYFSCRRFILNIGQLMMSHHLTRLVTRSLRLCSLKSHRSLQLRHYRAAFLLLILRNSIWTSQSLAEEESSIWWLSWLSAACLLRYHPLRCRGTFAQTRHKSSRREILPSLNR